MELQIKFGVVIGTALALTFSSRSPLLQPLRANAKPRVAIQTPSEHPLLLARAWIVLA